MGMGIAASSARGGDRTNLRRSSFNFYLTTEQSRADVEIQL